MFVSFFGVAWNLDHMCLGKFLIHAILFEARWQEITNNLNPLSTWGYNIFGFSFMAFIFEPHLPDELPNSYNCAKPKRKEKSKNWLEKTYS